MGDKGFVERFAPGTEDFRLQSCALDIFHQDVDGHAVRFDAVITDDIGML